MKLQPLFFLKKNFVNPVPFYDLSSKTILGEDFLFSNLRGKKVLLVNLASKCGFTPQYEDLEKLYREYRETGFVILGYPSNDFLNQESGTDAEILSFCKLNYDVSFPMMSKIKVKGKDQHPVYQWLTQKKLNSVINSRVKWNFQKYMVDRNGKLKGFVRPSEPPYCQRIIDFINYEP